MSKDESKLYLFKALGFNLAKLKFDTKGFSITNLPLPVENTDAVNFEFLKKEFSPIKTDIQDVKDLIKAINTTVDDNKKLIKQNAKDIIGFNDKIEKNSNVTEEYLTAKSFNDMYINIMKEINIFTHCDIKEILFEINAKKQGQGNFFSKRIIAPGLNKYGLSSTNIYSTINLVAIGTRITFYDGDNKEIHVAQQKNKKELKEAINIIIKNKEKTNTLYKFVSNKIADYVNINDKNILLDKRFLDKVQIEPENIGNCFVTDSADAHKHKNVRELTSNVENIHIEIVFVVSIVYKTKSIEQNNNGDD